MPVSYLGSAQEGLGKYQESSALCARQKMNEFWRLVPYPYPVVPIVDNTVLCTYKFVKRVDLTLSRLTIRK